MLFTLGKNINPVLYLPVSIVFLATLNSATVLKWCYFGPQFSPFFRNSFSSHLIISSLWFWAVLLNTCSLVKNIFSVLSTIIHFLYVLLYTFTIFKAIIHGCHVTLLDLGRHYFWYNLGYFLTSPFVCKTWLSWVFCSIICPYVVQRNSKENTRDWKNI